MIKTTIKEIFSYKPSESGSVEEGFEVEVVSLELNEDNATGIGARVKGLLPTDLEEIDLGLILENGHGKERLVSEMKHSAQIEIIHQLLVKKNQAEAMQLLNITLLSDTYGI